MTKQEDLHKIVEDINAEIFEKLPNGAEHLNLQYLSDGSSECISFPEHILIYEDTDRGWDDAKDDYERTLLQQIILEVNIMQAALNIIAEAAAELEERNKDGK